METRTVKFNIKHFIDEYACSIESKDSDSELELTEKLTSVLRRSSPLVQYGIKHYISNSKVAKEYSKLQDIVSKYVDIVG